MGDIYTINYKQLWEDKYENLSFGQFKRAFFSGKLKDFEISKKCIPEHLLSINTIRSSDNKDIDFQNVIDKSRDILNAIEDGLSEYAYEKKHLTIKNIAEIIKK